MNQAIKNNLVQRFSEYFHAQHAKNDEQQQLFKLKYTHCQHVRKAVLDIGKNLYSDLNHLDLAEVAGLYHDIGRFEQARRYDSCLDYKTEDHAVLGAKIVRKEHLLFDLNIKEQEIILTAIALHNKIELPDTLDSTSLWVTKLLRDADKLDIWRVVTEYYQSRSQNKNAYIELELSDSPFVTEDVCLAVMKKKLVRLNELKSLNDFKILQMGWVFDINFIETLRLLVAREYIQSIINTLPDLPIVHEVATKVRSYIEKRLDT